MSWLNKVLLICGIAVYLGIKGASWMIEDLQTQVTDRNEYINSEVERIVR